MARRRFLKLLSGAAAWHALGACASRPAVSAPRARRPIKGICFDLFTLFDPRSVLGVAERLAPGRGQELGEALRSRQFEYAWLRAVAGQYADFARVTDEALQYAARARGIALSPAQRQEIVDAYSLLEPWPDTRATLAHFKQQGLRLAPLANYAPAMLERLIAHADLGSHFDDLISTDRAATFKPDPRAYALGAAALGLSRDEIAFSAFGGWDAAGARWYGYPTFWVNRLGVAEEVLPPGPDAQGATLEELAQFVATW